ncbi:hypothetical protein TSMEX_001205 [Taenia solium]|eukprot:TsM_000880600 transcript=TsM_000880600 gene=TsM_000880600
MPESRVSEGGYPGVRLRNIRLRVEFHTIWSDMLSVTELSQVLQALSEKARAGTQHIQHLRTISETVVLPAYEVQPCLSDMGHD